MRIAPTFMRFGSFEIFKPHDPMTGGAGPSIGLKDKMLPPMLNYLLKYHCPEISSEFDGDETLPQQYKILFENIVRSTARLASLWQCYGFCHGVLNTDNLSVMGVTIDYGPFAWMEHHDPDFICNHSDQDRGRYRYKAQPDICKWNLEKLAEALDPILDIEFSTNLIREQYDIMYLDFWTTRMAQKLGFLITEPVEPASIGTSRPTFKDSEFR